MGQVIGAFFFFLARFNNTFLNFVWLYYNDSNIWKCASVDVNVIR